MENVLILRRKNEDENEDENWLTHEKTLSISERCDFNNPTSVKRSERNVGQRQNAKRWGISVNENK